MSYESFLEKIEIQDAVLRNFEIIGEALKNIPLTLKKTRKNIPWRELPVMQDKIIHFYFGVNLDIVWATIKEKLPELKKKVI